MAEIFNITHDADNLNEYDATQTDGTDLSTTTPGLADSTAKMSLLIDDTNALWGQKNFSQLTTAAFRYRFYIDPNTLTMAEDDAFVLLLFRQSANWRAIVQLQYASSAYKVRARVYDDNGSWNNTSWYTISDAEHWIEVLIQYATGADANNGEMTLWADDIEQENKGSLDIYTVTKPDNALFGAPSGLDSGTEGTFYLDEFVLNDDGTEIGPVVAAPLGFASIF